MANSNAKHTPGPWSVRLLSYGEGPGRPSAIVRADNKALAQFPWTCKATRADAALIAAAPDLLGALREVMERHCSSARMPCGCEACERARAAIAKATGGDHGA